MKKLILTGFCLVLLAGCSSEYIITTTDGKMLTTHDKPTLDETTGMMSFEDEEGRTQQIPSQDVQHMLER